jgi:hypothetical protein
LDSHKLNSTHRDQTGDQGNQARLKKPEAPGRIYHAHSVCFPRMVNEVLRAHLWRSALLSPGSLV